MRVLIVLATYNELENLPGMVDAVLQAVPEADILVVDDDSPDGTAAWVRERAAREPRVHLRQRSGKRGLGTAILEAFRYAIEHDCRLLINLDADWSHPPESIPVLLAEAEQYDVVIGSRYIRGGRIVGWPWFRRIMSRCVNLYARLLLGLRTRDNSGSFRCYRVETLEKLDLESFRSTGYSFFEEVLFRLKRVGARFKEVPITFTERRFGVSKINLCEAFRALWHILLIAMKGK